MEIYNLKRFTSSRLDVFNGNWFLYQVNNKQKICDVISCDGGRETLIKYLQGNLLNLNRMEMEHKQMEL